MVKLFVAQSSYSRSVLNSDLLWTRLLVSLREYTNSVELFVVGGSGKVCMVGVRNFSYSLICDK